MKRSPVSPSSPGPALWQHQKRAEIIITYTLSSNLLCMQAYLVNKSFSENTGSVRRTWLKWIISVFSNIIARLCFFNIKQLYWGGERGIIEGKRIYVDLVQRSSLIHQQSEKKPCISEHRQQRVHALLVRYLILTTVGVGGACSKRETSLVSCNKINETKPEPLSIQILVQSFLVYEYSRTWVAEHPPPPHSSDHMDDWEGEHRKLFRLKAEEKRRTASELHMNQLLLIQLMTASPDIKQIRNLLNSSHSWLHP